MKTRHFLKHSGKQMQLQFLGEREAGPPSWTSTEEERQALWSWELNHPGPLGMVFSDATLSPPPPKSPTSSRWPPHSHGLNAKTSKGRKLSPGVTLLCVSPVLWYFHATPSC